jgi:phage FluMu gp28-like protein
LVLLVSPSLRQSGELFRTTMGFYARLEGVPKLTLESALRAQFSNGSRIVSLPGSEKTTRGYSRATLIVVDEAARIEDTLMGALRPMLATSEGGGKFVMLSTPAGKRGEFYKYWSEGGEDWHRVEVPASACPRISPEFLAEELRQLGQQRFDEEYGLAWLDPDEAVFPTAIIDAAFTSEVTPLWN